MRNGLCGGVALLKNVTPKVNQKLHSTDRMQSLLYREPGRHIKVLILFLWLDVRLF